MHGFLISADKGANKILPQPAKRFKSIFLLLLRPGGENNSFSASLGLPVAKKAFFSRKSAQGGGRNRRRGLLCKQAPSTSCEQRKKRNKSERAFLWILIAPPFKKGGEKQRCIFCFRKHFSSFCSAIGIATLNTFCAATPSDEKKTPWQSPLFVFAQEISAAKKSSRVFDFCVFFRGEAHLYFPLTLEGERIHQRQSQKRKGIIGESSTCSRKSLLLCMVLGGRALSWLQFDNGEAPSLGTCTSDIGGGRRAKVLYFSIFVFPYLSGGKVRRRKREREGERDETMWGRRDLRREKEGDGCR